jgi:hypothetical protein
MRILVICGVALTAAACTPIPTNLSHAYCPVAYAPGGSVRLRRALAAQGIDCSDVAAAQSSGAVAVQDSAPLAPPPRNCNVYHFGNSSQV